MSTINVVGANADTGRPGTTVQRRQEVHRINIENDRLAQAILSKKSEFSRK